ncbi:MAG: acyl-CoA synthetase FdrA [Armatimonadota bacterium]|nr:acyl-CoA synthetase FdrA [Armatimonadota bacterium]MDR7402845.1 acyl-CoA synthetase FdrA [Armatimonadota bacterium]MDR7405107.1 acyl-CoA synthetase FdrA [Armatimonadota bacterium]MDR7436184.1 acyl-CoA synthetase FdrA [Armatimonadota bacterium]MDR7472063.1 acyl-CoA synthetase FdrA [Armatimonadota bacterium]
MVVRSVIKPSAYADSVALMLVQREVRALPGVQEAGAVMGTEANKELLKDAGLLTPEVEAAGPNDLILVVRADSEQAAAAALERAQALLARPREAAAGGDYRPRTVASAARMLEGANLALVSVPGRFAAGVAREALDAGLHVMLFSDNVPLDAEISLKQAAAARDLLLMGPDCGTAILGGAALGFANRVRRGAVGIVGAAGTGIQQVASLVHLGGAGISHALGTGGRDLHRGVGGLTARAALAALAADPRTEVIVLVSKPPDPQVASTLLGLARQVPKPTVAAFLGAAVTGEGRVRGAATLEEAARVAVQLATGREPRWPHWEALPAQEAARLAPSQKFIRGLYSGGTLCYEALLLLERYVGPVWSNTPLDPDRALESGTRSREHTVVDMGADEFTVGRLHPMLDPTLRIQRILREADDPEVAVLLLDVVLGYGAHPDPARELAPAIRQARERARAAGRWLPVVVSVCGTEEDPQDYHTQVATLVDAGAIVQATNAQAARLAGLIAEAAGSRGRERPPVQVPPPAEVGPLPDAPRIRSLLDGPVHVVNVGLEMFARSLADQGVPVVDVDWQPPAGGDRRLMDILDKLNA